MQFTKSKERVAVLIGIGVVIAIVLFAVISKVNDKSIPMDSAYINLVEKKKTLAMTRIYLLKSVEMEKNAVMALTDEEALNFANQSRIVSVEVEKNLNTLHSLIDAIPSQDEKKFLVEFTNCWTELNKLDQVILAIAVQSTNLKAARLSREKGAEILQRFENPLQKIISSSSGTSNEGLVVRLVCQALTATLKIYTLHSPHIAEASDDKMGQIEMQMKAEEDKAFKALDELDEIAHEENKNSLFLAKTAFNDFLEVTDQVIQLSRQNSNLKSLELSLGRKRKILAQCDEILATFQEDVQNRSLKPRK
jgi:hypothetical protein